MVEAVLIVDIVDALIKGSIHAQFAWGIIRPALQDDRELNMHELEQLEAILDAMYVEVSDEFTVDLSRVIAA